MVHTLYPRITASDLSSVPNYRSQGGIRTQIEEQYTQQLTVILFNFIQLHTTSSLQNGHSSHRNSYYNRHWCWTCQQGRRGKCLIPLHWDHGPDCITTTRSPRSSFLPLRKSSRTNSAGSSARSRTRRSSTSCFLIRTLTLVATGPLPVGLDRSSRWHSLRATETILYSLEQREAQHSACHSMTSTTMTSPW